MAEPAVEPFVIELDLAKVERCLQTLGERDRRVLILTFYAENTSAEIADELGLTERRRPRGVPPRARSAARMCRPTEAGMTDRGCTAPIEFVDIVDYWTGDLPRTTTEAIEEHMFTCAECAHQLAEGEALARGIAAVVREGRFHAIVTDAFLNRLAQDGVRIRMYAVTTCSSTPVPSTARAKASETHAPGPSPSSASMICTGDCATRLLRDRIEPHDQHRDVVAAPGLKGLREQLLRGSLG